jgi:hypothetical protein
LLLPVGHIRQRKAVRGNTNKTVSDDKWPRQERARAKVIEHESIGAHILEDPNREGTSYRFFNIDATPGYHQLIWDGTFTGRRNRPPEAGVYRIEISVAGDDGKTEVLYDQIRVENPENATVLPRGASGLAISTLTFDGRTLILTDDGGNTIEVPATSGLKPNNKKNPDKVDYTDPKWEWEAGN